MSDRESKETFFFLFFKEISKEETQVYIYKDPKVILRTHLICYYADAPKRKPISPLINV